MAVVGYAAAGVGGGLLASLVAFTPSFVFVLAGGPHFGRLRRNQGIQAFLTGAGPAAIGAIAGATIPLTLALSHLWQLAVLGLAGLWLIALRRGVVSTLVGSAALGVIAVLAGAPAADRPWRPPGYGRGGGVTKTGRLRLSHSDSCTVHTAAVSTSNR